MKTLYELKNPFRRIAYTHYLVVFILSCNVLLFTDNLISIATQVVLIIAVIIHNIDDRNIHKKYKKIKDKLLIDAKLVDKHVLISETDLEGRITHVNQNFCKISQYTKEELLGQPHSIIRHPDVPHNFFEKMWQTLLDNKQWHGVIKNRAKDGSEYWVDTTIYPIRINNNKVGYKAVRFDITDSILLKSKFSLIQHVIDSIEDIIIVFQNNRAIFANQTAKNFLGLSFIEKLFKQESVLSELFIHKDGFFVGSDDCLESLNDVNKEEKKVAIKHHLNSEEHIFAPTVSYDAENTFFLRLKDITQQESEKQQLEQTIDQVNTNLERQNNRFEFAINSSRDGFWDFDIVNQTFYLNSGWRERLGFHEDETISYLDYMHLIPDENFFLHHNAIHDALDSCLKQDETCQFIHFRIEYPIVSKFGEKIIIDDVGDIFFDEDHNPIRITGFHRDITQQVKQAKIIEQQNRLSAMGDALNNVAHQWRQPLGAINNILNDIEFDIDLEELESISSTNFIETSEKIKNLTNFLSQTIDDFKVVSQEDKPLGNFVIETLIRDTFSLVEQYYKEHEIDFSFSIEDKELSYFGLERELKQVILNILNNAKDALVSNKIENKKVWITVTQDEQMIILRVHDNAGGIPESIINKLFEPYFTTKHESLGTGIGLYMSKKIITEYFKGELSVSNYNKGALFTIKLPREV